MNIPDKYCHNCGKKVLIGGKFCSSCGTSLASIDEKPPVPEQRIPNDRIRPKTPTTFTPRVVGEDEDDEILKVDRVESINELNLSMSSLDVDFGRTFDKPRETVAGLMSQGANLPQGGTEEKRLSPAPLGQEEIIKQFAAEAGTLRQK